MSPVRDFSSTVKEELLRVMQEIETADSQFWVFSGIIDFITDPFIKDNIAAYEGDIEAFHRAVLDKKNTSVEQLEAIWTKVYEVDAEYARTFQNMADNIDELTGVFQSLANALDPSQADAGGIPFLIRSPEGLEDYLRPYTSLQSEYDADHRMQDEIFELLNEERFSRVTWDNADAEGRQAMLQELYDSAREIMGTSANPAINFEALGPRPNEGGSVTMGFYRHHSQIITINSDLLMDDEYGFGLLDTVIHENRHAYQYEAIDSPRHYAVSAKTRSVWEENFKNYINAKDNFRAYQAQAVEWDARGFANQDSIGVTPVYEGSWPHE